MRARCRLALLVLVATSACGPASPPVATSGRPPAVLLVGVTGLVADDPLLDSLPADALRSTDVLATGTGSTALMEWLEGREAVEQLRAPRDPLHWACGGPVEVEIMDRRLASEPEWVRVARPADRAAGGLRPPAAGVRVVVTGRDALDGSALEAALASASDALLVVVAGLPAPVDPDRPPLAALDAGRIAGRFRVPVVARGRGSEELGLQGRRVLGEVLAPLHGHAPERDRVRRAHWWNSRGGGVLVDDGQHVAVGGSGRTAVLVDPSATDRADSLVAAALPRGDLLVMIRGSEEADLARFEILTGAPARWSPWGLEPIDLVEHPSPRYLRLDLAVEPAGDGLVIGSWEEQMIDLRVLTVLEDAPVIGAPIRDAIDGTWLGLNALRIQPWSRCFWRLTRPAEFDAATWSAGRSAGLDLLWIPAGGTPPTPLEP